MYLSESERKDVMAAYGYGNAIEKDHRQVGPDTWIYLFEFENTEYILISTDYLGDYEFEIFPHLLKFEDAGLEFVLQQEVPMKHEFPEGVHTNTILFTFRTDSRG